MTSQRSRKLPACLHITIALCLCLPLFACGGGGTDAASPQPDDDPANGSGSGSETELAPLPNPPLSEGPSADDEPIPENADFHTASGFAVVRDPQAFPVTLPTAAFSEADFMQGLPDAVIERPAGVDLSGNEAPYFEGLDNVRVVAGTVLELRFVPRDPEGELPGMFPQELPEGASFDDNFDGTKTLRWRPLQTDLGVSAFTAVAVDPAEPRLRVAQSVLIAVDAPDDPTTIPNISPGIDEIEDYVVRVGDPVVIEIEGVDRNGTTPTLELIDPPAGATFLPRPFEAERYVLRFVPDTVGERVIEVLARDAVDPSLIGTGQIVLDVRDRDAFQRPGLRLKTLSLARGLTTGTAVSPFFYRQADGALYADIASTEHAIMTHESGMKMDRINPLPGHYAFADTDNLMQFARANDMTVRGHPLVWHRQLPEWVLATPASEREIHMREFIARIVGRYANDVAVWDVINEPLGDDGELRESIWFDAMGESYIDTAFRQARAIDADATLVLNEYDIAFDGPKFDALLALIDRLIAREVPIDAVGFQLHLFASFDAFDELASHMATVAARGLDIHITELDVALSDDADESGQTDVYRRIVEICLAEPRCTTLQTWGFTDRYSFRSQFDPLPFDVDYQAKPAYTALQEALSR